MNLFRLSAFSVFCLAAADAPASAQFNGSLALECRNSASLTESFAGKIERIQLRTLHEDTLCSVVRATFGNGATSEIFHGLVSVDRVERIIRVEDPPIQRLDFTCKGTPPTAQIEVKAELGRHEAD